MEQPKLATGDFPSPTHSFHLLSKAIPDSYPGTHLPQAPTVDSAALLTTLCPLKLELIIYLVYLSLEHLCMWQDTISH